jgi:hypothetical protein
MQSKSFHHLLRSAWMPGLAFPIRFLFLLSS